MKRAKIIDLKKYLKGKSEKELIDEIVELFKTNKQVQEIYSIKLNPQNEEILLEEYKDKVIQQFFPSRGMNVLNYNVLKKLISDFEKVAIKKSNVIELLLCYAENGVDFTNSYGDIDEQFYNNISKIYEKALYLIAENNLEEKYLEDCQNIMNDATGIGWGFGDWMDELFYDYFGDFIKE
jgi:hypothetical protein